MLSILRAENRGKTNLGWLNSKHTFSFGEYYNPRNMGFRNLRVINDDIVAPGKGFGTHPHRDMEIISYVVRGALEHKDSMGNGSVIHAGDIQRMTAGTGILHSEFNNSQQEQVHFLQIWILPEKRNLTPEYDQIHVTTVQKKNKLCLLASGKGNGLMKINQDVNVMASVLGKDKTLNYEIASDRCVWVQIIHGELTVGKLLLHPGDGLAVENEHLLELKAREDTEFLLFDLA
jgi:redox-sensitive bicupin YhaK (pirin superfamily)